MSIENQCGEIFVTIIIPVPEKTFICQTLESWITPRLCLHGFDPSHASKTFDYDNLNSIETSIQNLSPQDWRTCIQPQITQRIFN